MDAATQPALLVPGLPAGFTARAVDPETDAEGVEALVEAFDAAYTPHPSDPPGEVMELAKEALANGGAAVVVHGPDGRVAALAYVEVHDPAVPSVFADVFVHPDGDDALPAAVLRWGLETARAWRDGEGRAATKVDTGIARPDERLAAAARELGFEHERVFWRMERTLGDDVAQVPPAPAGVVVRVADGPADEATIHRLHETAFAEHWGFHARDLETFFRDLRRPAGCDPAQWWIAEVDGEPLGYLVGERRELATEQGGYVRQVGVLAQARGRGLARHLLRVAFAEHTRRGWAWTQLGVDAENHTGATTLYRSVGMAPVETVDAFAARLA